MTNVRSWPVTARRQSAARTPKGTLQVPRGNHSPHVVLAPAGNFANLERFVAISGFYGNKSGYSRSIARLGGQCSLHIASFPGLQNPSITTSTRPALSI